MSVFDGKTLLITGGTGSFGNAVLNRFLKTDIGEIRDTMVPGTVVPLIEKVLQKLQKY